MPFEMNHYHHKGDEFVDDIIYYALAHINAKIHTKTKFVNKCTYDYNHVCPQGLVFHPFHAIIDLWKTPYKLDQTNIIWLPLHEGPNY